MTIKKVWRTLFVYQSDGSDKTLTTINDAIPHTRNMQKGLQNAPNHTYTRNECYSLSRCRKNCQIFRLGLQKTLSICPSCGFLAT